MFSRAFRLFSFAAIVLIRDMIMMAAMILMIVQEIIYVFTCELLNLNLVKFLDDASKCRIHIDFF